MHKLSTRMKVSVYLDKRRKTTTGENTGRYQIKIRLSYTIDKRTFQRPFQTGCYVTADEYARLISKRAGKDARLQAIETRVHDLYEQGKTIIRENPFIDPEAFGSELTNAGSFKSPLDLFAHCASILEADGRIGTAESYRQAASSFRVFAGDNLTFGAITPSWLQQYEKWMIRGSEDRAARSITTVGIYCRALRAVFNFAISKKKLHPGTYPFGRGKYVIPTATGRKMALTESQKDKLMSFRTLAPDVQRAADFWIFSYLSYGMNFADIAHLRFGDIRDNTIVLNRAKTKNTERDRSLIEIPIRPEAVEVIKRWGNWNDSLNPSAYVFPVLRPGLTARQAKARIHDFIADTNSGLSVACAELGLPKITTYWARHTFATIANKKGADLETIQKALGHSDIRTTQVYINSFDLETRQKVSSWL